MPQGSLGNKIFGSFNQAFRNVGIGFNHMQAENLRDTCFDLAEIIEKAATEKAIESSKRLEATSRKAFQEVSKDIDLMKSLKKDVYNVQEKLDILLETIKPAQKLVTKELPAIPEEPEEEYNNG